MTRPPERRCCPETRQTPSAKAKQGVILERQNDVSRNERNSTGSSLTIKYWVAFDLGVNNLSKRPRYRRDPRKYDTNKQAFPVFRPQQNKESKIARMTKCSIIHATHVLISGPRASQLKIELTKKLLAHVACERSTPLSVWSFLGPSALPIVYKSATDLPASPNIVVLP